MVHGCMVHTERTEMATVLCGTSHVTTKQWWIFKKHAIKKRSLIQNHLQQECSESARERRIVLYKSDNDQQ